MGGLKTLWEEEEREAVSAETSAIRGRSVGQG